MSQCGSLLMVPERESVQCTDRAQAGTHVNQQNFYQRESQILNEIFNNIPEVKEISDEDTIVYTSGSNGKPLLASIKKEFDLNQVIRKLY